MRESRNPAPLASAQNTLRAIKIIVQQGAVTVTGLARELGTSASTAHRILATCLAQQFVRQDTVRGLYVVGPAIHEISLIASSAAQLREAAGQELSKAAQALNETVSFITAEGKDGRVVESVEGDQVVRITSLLGQQRPLHSFAAGRAILATLPPEEAERRLATRVSRHPGAHEHTEWDRLQRELDRIRTRGWAADLGEENREIGAVAFPITDSSGEQRGAVSVDLPLSRMGTRSEAVRVAELLRPYVSSIQRRLRGGH